MRLLIIDEATRRRAKEIEAYAQAHPYPMGEGAIPGGLSQHVLLVEQGYQCVFSYTLREGKRYRHLSVGVGNPPSQHVLPHPAAVQELGGLFGFVLQEGGYLMGPHHHEPCVVLFEEVK